MLETKLMTCHNTSGYYKKCVIKKEWVFFFVLGIAECSIQATSHQRWNRKVNIKLMT